MLLVLLGAALHAAWNGIVKTGPDRYLDIASLLAAAALLTLLWLPFLPLPARACWPYLAASALIHQVYFTFVALAYRKGEMSVVYPLMRGMAPALTALASALVLREHPSVGGYIGVCLVSGGVVLLTFERRGGAKIALAPALLALANAGVIAFYTLVDGVGVRLSGHAFSYTSWGFLLSASLFAPTALLLRRREAVAHFKGQWRNSFIGAGCSLASYGLALWAMTKAPIATVAALRETAILFGLVLAVFSLKEKVRGGRVVAVALVAAGAVIIKLS